MLRAAHAYETATPWRSVRPRLESVDGSMTGISGNRVHRARTGARPGTGSGGRGDRAAPRASGADRRSPGRARPLPPSVAALAGRRRIAAGGLCASHRGGGEARRQHRMVPRPGEWLHDDRGLLDPEVAQEIFGGGGASSRGRRGRPRPRGRGRLSADRDLELRQRQPSCDLARRPCGDPRRGWHAAVAAGRRAGDRTLLFPKASAEFSESGMSSVCADGQRQLYRLRLFVPESHTVLREAEPKLRQPGLLYAFSSSNIYSAGFAGVALGIARALWTLYRARARQDPARRQTHVARRQCRAVASRAIGSAAQGGARFPVGFPRGNLA